MKMNRCQHLCLRPLFCMLLVTLVLVLFLPAAQALKPGEVSLTAEMAAALRAVSTMDPDEKIRNPDVLSPKFVSPNFWFFGPLVKDYKKNKDFIKTYRMSHYYTVNANTWHIDAILQDLATNDLKQIVHIGAGFGSRPYRFGQQMPHVKFFEVDQAATQNLKKTMVKAAVGALPAEVTYIPIDYRTRPVFDALKQAGYDENQKTLFIWEGSTQYTESSVVDRIMRSIGNHSGAGSEIVFDYIPSDIVQGDYSRYPGARFAAVRLDAAGESWTFGIPEGQADEFVAKRGFKVISDLGSSDLARKYLVRSDGTIDGRPTAAVRIMHAVVDR